MFEILAGGLITTIGLLGIILLSFGAYALDTGTFRWQIPTKLLFIMIPISSFWAIALFLVRIASTDVSPNLVSFYQLIGVGTIGIILYIFVKPYRDGFLIRVREQGKKFIGFSLINESFAQLGYVSAMLAIAAAPVAAYFTSMAGMQGIMLLILLFLFPLHERDKITLPQVIAIILITLGIFIIEFWK